MKTKFFIAAIMILMLVTSCKNDKKAEGTDTAGKPAVKENFNVEMTVVTEKSDNFTVYYTENKTNEYVGAQAVWKGVKGGNAEEVVSIDLPEEIIPTNIRVDFGINPDRKDVIVKNMKFTYYGKTFEFKGSDFPNYFIKDNLVPTEVDAQNGTVKIIKTAEKKDGTYFYPSAQLLAQISKLTKSN